MANKVELAKLNWETGLYSYKYDVIESIYGPEARQRLQKAVE